MSREWRIDAGLALLATASLAGIFLAGRAR